jgi:hypothetical protein
VPFTLAHPAAILPLRGWRYLRTVPLIIGAMIPDARDYVPSTISHYMYRIHSFRGSYTTCLVLGFALLAAVFGLRRPLTALLSVRARWLCLNALGPFSRDSREWAFAPLAILIGAWTHLLWDSFTHNDGWVVHRVAVLSATVTIGSYRGTVCHVLQYLSSAFGLAVMVVWYWRLPTPHIVRADPDAQRSAVGPVLMLVATAALLIGGVKGTDYFAQAHNVYGTMNVFLTHGLAWFAALYLIAGTIVTLERTHEHSLDLHA